MFLTHTQTHTGVILCIILSYLSMLMTMYKKKKKENSVSGINYYWTLFVRIRVLLKELIHEITVAYAFGLNLIL